MHLVLVYKYYSCHISSSKVLVKPSIPALLAGPLIEHGGEAIGHFNVFDRKNELWPDVGFFFYALPFVSLRRRSQA